MIRWLMIWSLMSEAIIDIAWQLLEIGLVCHDGRLSAPSQGRDPSGEP